MLGYIGQIVGLVGAIIGLAGDTWDKKRPGLRKLKRNGWIALAVILIGFALSVVSTYRQDARNRRLQAAAAAEIERSWRALVYPFTLMLWHIQGHSVGYDTNELQHLLEPELFAKVMAIDVRGEAPHYSGPWKTVLGESSRNGKQGLESAGSRFNAFLDDELLVSVQGVLACYYLDVLTGAESNMAQIEAFPGWVGKPYPLQNLVDPKQADKYIRALLALRAQLDKHVPKVQPAQQ